MLLRISVGVLIGLICGALVPAFIVAALQFPDFFSNQYEALGKQVFQIFGFTFTTVTLRGGAFLTTLMVACIGASFGGPLGFIFGVVAAVRKRRSTMK